MATYLDDILVFHRARVAGDERHEIALAASLTGIAPPRDFAGALREAKGIGVIAEVKRRSPSKGLLAPDLDPVALAEAYAVGGASCLSVLTDAPHFGGSSEDLIAARAATSLPVLRKDFTLDRRDSYDARLMGADAVLLIVAALTDAQLADFLVLGAELGLDCLVEVHDEAELARALDAGASLVGVNQRDLHTFAVDPDRACRVGLAMPDGVVRVAESGITVASDVARLVDAGFDAILVGEALVTAVDPAGAVQSLRGVVGRWLTMFVKICGVTSEEDALLAIAMGADAVGFIFAPSPRQVIALNVAKITSRLPPEILTVGVFRDEHPERVVEIVFDAGLRAAQLHGHETVEDVTFVASHVRHVIKAFAATSPALDRAGDLPVDAILIDGPSPGSGRVFDWRLAEGMPKTRRIIIGGGLNADNVAEAIARVRPWGVDASSGLESSPGHKDPSKVRAFIKAARRASPEDRDEDPILLASSDAPYDWQAEQ